MKTTGIVRRVDELGRVVLPKELRKTMDIHKKDPMEIFVEGDSVILRKYEAACMFCGSNEDLVTFENHKICKACAEKIAASAEEA